MFKNYLDDWNDSSVDKTIISLNVKELQGEEPYEYLFYDLDEKERRNDGRLRDNWIKRYAHIDAGGWWCAGINLLTFQPSEWGCFKPYDPRIIEGKPRKYEHPPKTPTEVFALKVPYRIGLSIAQRYGLEDEYDVRLSEDQDMEAEDKEFWQWVVKNPRIEVTLTEGAKKTGCLLTAGYCALGLPGIYSGYRTNTNENTGEKTKELIPQLKVLTQHSRCFNFAFDADERWKTQINVKRAIRETAKLIQDEGCLASVATWGQKEGKGVDDIVAKNKGDFGRLHLILEEALLFEEWQDEHDEVRIYRHRSKILDFVEAVFGKRLKYNELSQRIELDEQEIELDDCLIDGIIRDYRIESDKDKIFGTIISTAKRNSYHPVREYLKKCYEAGNFADIDTISTRYLKTSDPLYDYMVRQWLIAAVGRALRPGCTVQFALVLKQQKEGSGKSTFFKKLAGSQWFDDNFGSDFSVKSLMSLHTGTWIEEWPEIEQISKGKESSTVKAFITRDVDKFVANYARESKNHKRGFIFCGTTNEDRFLKSPTGDRRFFVIDLDYNLTIDQDALVKERDAIWASAVRECLRGWEDGADAWRIPEDVLRQIMESNRESREIHPWEEAIVSAIESKNLQLVNIGWLLDAVIEIPLKDRTARSQKIVSEILTGLGWHPLKNPVMFSETNTKVRCWAAPKAEEHPDGTPGTPIGTPTEQGGCSECTPEPERVVEPLEHLEHLEHQKQPLKTFSVQEPTSVEKPTVKVGTKIRYYHIFSKVWLDTEVTALELKKHGDTWVQFRCGDGTWLSKIFEDEDVEILPNVPWRTMKEK